MPDGEAVAPEPLERWIAAEALRGNDLGSFLEALCLRLLAEGLRIARVSASLPTVDPVQRAQSVIWRRDGGLTRETTDHSPGSEERFAQSPIYALQAAGLTSGRWRLDPMQSEPAVLPLVAMLAGEGCTDYVLHLAAFPAETAISGLAFSAASDAPGGFSEGELARIEAVLPFVTIAVCRMAVTRTAAEVLRIYLGPRTGERVLAGQVRRGEGEAIAAAILFADMRDFTGLNERVEMGVLIDLLNEQFEALGEAIGRRGGEILKFMGDGLLAIFPIGDDGPAACRAALDAAESGLGAIDRLNAARTASGGPVLDADIALHAGDVFYGNVGAARRLDFTVVGPAVNEAARIERLCDRLGERLLLSKAFADLGGLDSRPLGAFRLKGVGRDLEVHGPAQPWPRGSLPRDGVPGP